MAACRQNHHLELALHLTDLELFVQPVGAGQHQQARALGWGGGRGWAVEFAGGAVAHLEREEFGGEATVPEAHVVEGRHARGAGVAEGLMRRGVP